MANGCVMLYIRTVRRRDNLDDKGFADLVNRMLLQLAIAIDYLHRQNIVYGDIRTVKTLVDEDKNLRLAAFGTSCYAVDPSKPSADPYTPYFFTSGVDVRWSAPELLQAQRPRQTFASDAYAFECICIEMYTDEPPFIGLITEEVRTQVLQGIRPDKPATMPYSLWGLALWCPNANTQGRPQ